MLVNSLVIGDPDRAPRIAVLSLLSAFAFVYSGFHSGSPRSGSSSSPSCYRSRSAFLPNLRGGRAAWLLNSYAGLTIPLICGATATFLFRQFFMTIPDELCEAARIDGATAMGFFRDILLPLSRTNIARCS